MLIVWLEVLNDDISIAIEVARNDSPTFISLSLFQQIFPQSFWYFSYSLYWHKLKMSLTTVIYYLWIGNSSQNFR